MGLLFINNNNNHLTQMESLYCIINQYVPENMNPENILSCKSYAEMVNTLSEITTINNAKNIRVFLLSDHETTSKGWYMYNDDLTGLVNSKGDHVDMNFIHNKLYQQEQEEKDNKKNNIKTFLLIKDNDSNEYTYTDLVLELQKIKYAIYMQKVKLYHIESQTKYNYIKGENLFMSQDGKVGLSSDLTKHLTFELKFIAISADPNNPFKLENHCIKSDKILYRDTQLETIVLENCDMKLIQKLYNDPRLLVQLYILKDGELTFIFDGEGMYSINEGLKHNYINRTLDWYKCGDVDLFKSILNRYSTRLQEYKQKPLKDLLPFIDETFSGKKYPPSVIVEYLFQKCKTDMLKKYLFS